MNAAINPLESAPAASAKPKPRHTALRTALVAVIAAACLLSCMVVVQAAGLDVLSSEPMAAGSPFLSVKDKSRLLITPHVAWAAVEARQRLMKIIAGQIRDFFHIF